MMAWRIVICLGLAQLVSWGTAYYLIGNLGTALAKHLGWDSSVIYGGFSVALLVMGLTSSTIGKLIDQYGGRPVMIGGAILNATGCTILAFADHVVFHFVGWIVLGGAMRATLYDAAFATLAKNGHYNAGRMMGQITLFGGLASTVFWPLGHFIESEFGVVTALMVYAGCALLSAPLHLAIPAAQPLFSPDTVAVMLDKAPDTAPDTTNDKNNPRARHYLLCGILYALIVTMLNIVNAAMSAHMVAILIALGLSSFLAIETASLRGVGQSIARGCEVIFGRKLAPTKLTVIATGILPLSFILALFGDQYIVAAMAFTLLYGAANGVLTITRGTLPLMIFGTDRYGQRVGRLLFPGFILSAVAPSLFDSLITRFGPVTAIWTATGLLLISFACAIVLQKRLRSAPTPRTS